MGRAPLDIIDILNDSYELLYSSRVLFFAGYLYKNDGSVVPRLDAEAAKEKNASRAMGAESVLVLILN